jgi:hypothetical protein
MRSPVALRTACTAPGERGGKGAGIRYEGKAGDLHMNKAYHPTIKMGGIWTCDVPLLSVKKTA